MKPNRVGQRPAFKNQNSKLLKENLGGNVHNFELGNSFLGMTWNAESNQTELCHKRHHQ